MAARTRKIFHDEDTRARISAARIIDRLQGYALREDPDAMSRAQVTEAIALLNKVLPNLQSVDVLPADTRSYVLRAQERSESLEAWLRD